MNFIIYTLQGSGNHMTILCVYFLLISVALNSHCDIMLQYEFTNCSRNKDSSLSMFGGDIASAIAINYADQAGPHGESVAQLLSLDSKLILSSVDLTQCCQSNSFTFMLWYNMQGGNQVFNNLGDASLFLNGNTFGIGATSVPIKGNGWTHFCLANAGTVWQIFVNGLFVQSVTYTLSNSDWEPLISNFQGSLASIRLYNTALTAANVYDQYLARGSIATYDFPSGFAFKDTSGNSGSLDVNQNFGAMSLENDYLPKPIAYVSMHALPPGYLVPPVLYLRSLYGFTVCLWFKIEAVAPGSNIVFRFHDPVTQEVLLFTLLNTQVQFSIGTQQVAFAEATVLPTDWMHFCLRNSGTTWEIFRDTVLLNTITYQQQAYSYCDNQVGFFFGNVAFIHIFNSPLTSQQILQQYLLFQNCPVGYADASNCTECAPGSFQGFGSATVCQLCATGTYVSSAGATACEMCASGTYTSATGASNCAECAPGSFQGYGSATVCQLCATGTYVSSAGATACETCASGTYTSAAGASQCLTAGSDFFTQTNIIIAVAVGGGFVLLFLVNRMQNKRQQQQTQMAVKIPPYLLNSCSKRLELHPDL